MSGADAPTNLPRGCDKLVCECVEFRLFPSYLRQGGSGTFTSTSKTLVQHVVNGDTNNVTWNNKVRNSNMTEKQKLGGRFYGDNKTKTCIDCGLTGNWKEFSPHNGTLSPALCDACSTKRTTRSNARLKKEDLRNFQHLDWYIQGLRGNGPFGSCLNAMLGGHFREWIARMESYGEFNFHVAAKMLHDHYWQANAHRRKHWVVLRDDLEIIKEFHPVRRFKHPFVERKGRKSLKHKYIKAGDTVFLWTGSQLEQTVAIRATTWMPELGVELPVSIPKSIERDYRLDVYATSKVIEVSRETIDSILSSDKPKNHSVLLTARCSEQLETLFRES